MPALILVSVVIDEASRRHHAPAVGTMIGAICIVIWIVFRNRK
jgi:hypothetical protein